MTRTEMLAAKIPFCIFCGKPDGNLSHGNMVGPGHPPDEFPGDPTGTKYFGAGAGAYVYYHRDCSPKVGETVQKNDAFIAEYNALVAKHGKKIGWCGCCCLTVEDAESATRFEVDRHGNVSEVES